MVYQLGAPSFFKPKTQTSRDDSVLVPALTEAAQVHIRGQNLQVTQSCSSKVTSDGTDYTSGI